MSIGDGLIVNLEKLSLNQVKNTFMEIEEPEKPIDFSTEKMDVSEPQYNTIGEFYEVLKEKIVRLAPDDLPGDPSRQVTSSFFSDDVLFKILKKNDAVRAIDIIVEQGEGSATSPIDFEGDIAHYYRFEEIYEGHALVKDTSAPNGYSFTGKPIVFDPENVYNTLPNTKADMFPIGSEERRRIDDFNGSYHSLLKGLHKTFNGFPKHLDGTIGIMYDIKLRAERLCGTDFPGKPGVKIGPTFEYFNSESIA
jgi:hypothetical protein